MSPLSASPYTLRNVHPDEADTITTIARGMRETLIEVEGREQGEALYTMAWLEARVRWHLDPASSHARVVVAEDAHGQIAGHTIFRIETAQAQAQSGERVGLISTTWVWPEARRKGLALRFLAAAEDWFIGQGIASVSTWTSSTNTPLITLYTRSGYTVAERGPNDLTGTTMIRLARQLPAHR